MDAAPDKSWDASGDDASGDSVFLKMPGPAARYIGIESRRRVNSTFRFYS
jgi:hypothetical protein